jgi:hypothetical protein
MVFQVKVIVHLLTIFENGKIVYNFTYFYVYVREYRRSNPIGLSRETGNMMTLTWNTFST